MGFDFASFLGGLGEEMGKYNISEENRKNALEAHKFELAMQTAKLWQQSKNPALQKLGGNFSQLLYSHTGKPGYVDKIGGQIWKEYGEIPSQAEAPSQMKPAATPEPPVVPTKPRPAGFTPMPVPGVGAIATPTQTAQIPAYQARAYIPPTEPPPIVYDQSGEQTEESRMAQQQWAQQDAQRDAYNRQALAGNEQQRISYEAAEDYWRKLSPEEKQDEIAKVNYQNILSGHPVQQSRKMAGYGNIGKPYVDAAGNWWQPIQNKDTGAIDRLPMASPAESGRSLLSQYANVLEKFEPAGKSPLEKKKSAMERALSFRSQFAFDLSNPDIGDEAVPGAVEAVQRDPTTWNLIGTNKTFANKVRKSMFAPDMPTLIKLTAQMKGLGETSTVLIPKMDKVIKMLEDPKYKDELGKLMGRWNEFMTGTIGGGKPEYAELRTLGGLMQTGLMRAHVGARGGVQLLSKFEGMINTGKMDPEIFKQSVKAARDFISGYRDYTNDPRARAEMAGWAPEDKQVWGKGAGKGSSEQTPLKNPALDRLRKKAGLP